MAGDWIKMRGGLFSSPKLIAMSHRLSKSPQFREWLIPGGGSQTNGQQVSDHALRCVTGALLTVTWSWSRAFGEELQNGDCLLCHVAVKDIDGIAGAPGVGEAMAHVGWAFDSDKPPGVILPKFFLEYNVPLSNAEKQRAYREREKRKASVTKPLPTRSNKTVTRVEENRVEKKKEETYIKKRAPYEARFEIFWQAFPKVRRQGKEAAATAYKRAIDRLHLHPDPHAYLLERLALFAESDTAKSKYCWGPTPWLNQGHYDDDPAAWARDDPEDKPFDVADLHLDED